MGGGLSACKVTSDACVGKAILSANLMELFMSNVKLIFKEGISPFRAIEREEKEFWVDSSFSQSLEMFGRLPIGRLRMPFVDNGRYESKHPVLDSQDATVGSLEDGQASLGYTYECVFAGDCFWIAHQHFGASSHGGGSKVSLVAEAGTYLFSRNAKFKVIKSFEFGGMWIFKILAFRLLDDGANLLYLTRHGVCLFNTRNREIIAKTDFGELSYQFSGFALSPKAKLLALAWSAAEAKNPLDNSYLYRNFIRIYDLNSGLVLGEQNLPGDGETTWTVEFSVDGRQLRAVSSASAHIFELEATR
jgi:hypothetical protein